MSEKHLTELPWKMLTMKQKVKDTSLQKALAEYGKYDERAFDGRLKALDCVEKSATDLKKTNKDNKEVADYLSEVLAEAGRSRKAAELLKKSADAKAEGEEEDGSVDGAAIKKKMLSALTRVRSSKPTDPPMQFMACLAKADAAVLLNKSVGSTQKKMLLEMLPGASSPTYLTGDCIWEENSYTFVLQQVPGGLSKKLSKALFTETGQKSKVRVRSKDGKTIADSDTESEGTESESSEGTAPTSGTTQTPPKAPPQAPQSQPTQEPPKPPNVKATAGQFDAAAKIKELKSRIPGLIKTAAYSKTQAPDEKVRLLENLKADVTKSINFIKAKDPTAVVPPEAVTLAGKLDELLKATKGEAEGVVEKHVTEWNERLNRIATSKAVPAPVDPGERAKRAELLLEAIGEIEEGLHLDRAMLKRLGLDMESILKPVANSMAPLRQEYDSLKPQRTSTKDPDKFPPVSRPGLGKISGPLGDQFNQAINKTETAMATGKQPGVDDLDKVVEIIGGQINSVDLKRDLLDAKKYHKSWDAVKKAFKELSKGDKAKATEFMSDYWWFRRKTVDELMAKLQKKYDFNWASVGSANLESDYDISVNSHGTKDGGPYYDWQIVGEFNKTLSGEFGGAQPGTLFDTNLYASAKVELPDPDRPKSPVEQDMDAMSEAGQDVGALMKMRRYMDWESYEDYKNGSLEDMKKAIAGETDKTKQRAIAKRYQAMEKQFSEADSLYFMSLYKQLEKAGVTIPKDLSPEGQKKLLAAAHELENDPDKLMSTNNDLYVEAMEEVRQIEIELKKVDPQKNPDRHAELLAQLQTHQANATFFAAEAYHSQGPLKHIVEANQSSAAKVKSEHPEWPKQQQDDEIAKLAKAAMEKLSASQMLQSFNENLGDLLKDLKHYEEKSPFPGLGFYRSSKYLERICDAMVWIEAKLADQAPGAAADFKKITIAGKAPSVVKTAVAGLVDVRGGKKGFVDKSTDSTNGVEDPETEKEAYAMDEMNKIFPGVKTLRDLAATMTGVGRQVNSALRKAEIGQKMMATKDSPYFS